MKKISRRYSQTLYLFVIYGTFTLALLGIFFTFTYSYYRNNILENAKNTQENICASVHNAIEAQLDNLSTISMNIVYSNAIKTNFKQFSMYYQKTGKNPEMLVASHEKAMAIHDIVTAIIGAYQSASNIKLYTLDGSCVESGYYPSVSHVNIKAKAWYDKVIALNGHKFLTSPKTYHSLPATGDNHNSRKFISLIRLFLNKAEEPEGIVEIIQDCNKIFTLASQLEQNNTGTHIYVYNAEGQLMFPYNAPANRVNYRTLAEDIHLENGASTLATAKDGQNFLLSRKDISEYGWTVIIAGNKDTIYQPLRVFHIIFLLIAGFSIFFTLLVCFYISKKFTIPLKKLTAATGKITINRVLDEKKVNLTSADSSIKELSILCEAIRNMYEKLRSTSQEILLAQNEETRAKLLATQSLINPHFLYNSLTSIGIMAEEDMNEDIIQMCNALCDYFRYISSTQKMVVTLEQELYYTKRYLECMKFRFTDELDYTIDIAEDTKQICIPKLITQPIVENAFKYAFTDSPPWKLSITSLIEDNHWIIRIADNGGTLSDQRKEELLKTYENLDFKNELKSMEIGGMGLKNMYLRLKLVYGDSAIFQIDNSTPHRTVFVLGGEIRYHNSDI